MPGIEGMDGGRERDVQGRFRIVIRYIGLVGWFGRQATLKKIRPINNLLIGAQNLLKMAKSASLIPVFAQIT